MSGRSSGQKLHTENHIKFDGKTFARTELVASVVDDPILLQAIFPMLQVKREQGTFQIKLNTDGCKPEDLKVEAGETEYSHFHF